MSEQPGFPRVRVAGPPGARGRQYGAAASDRIHRTVDLYRQVFAHYAGWDWRAVCAHASGYVGWIRDAYPDYLDEMEGIANGSGLEFVDILAINVRTEIMFAGLVRRMVPECSAFALVEGATANGHVLLGQNWDWKRAARETVVVLEVERDDGPSFVTVVEAGLLAKVGFNSAGLGIATNALVSSDDIGGPGLPYHVILRAILEAPDLSSAMRIVRAGQRSSSANYLLATIAGDAVNIEARPGGIDQTWSTNPTDGILAHTNHFLAEVPGIDVMREHEPDTLSRLTRVTSELGRIRGGATTGDLGRLLADHESYPECVCVHPTTGADDLEADASIASVIMDITDSTLWLREGQPCEGEIRAFHYADFFAAASAARTGGH